MDQKIRPLLLLVLSFLFLFSVSALSQTVSYTYDQAGNRISRKVVTLPPPPQSAKPQVDSTSVEDVLSERSIIIYPNPTRGALKVDINGGDTEEELRIILYSGQGVQLYNSIAQPGISSVDMTAYPKGWYILRVIAGENKKDFKVIKE